MVPVLMAILPGYYDWGISDMVREKALFATALFFSVGLFFTTENYIWVPIAVAFLFAQLRSSEEKK